MAQICVVNQNSYNMKKLMTLFLLLMFQTAFTQAEYGTPPEGLIPEKIPELYCGILKLELALQSFFLEIEFYLNF